MDLAHDVAPEPRSRTDNPLVRAVGRVHLPLGAKLIAGFAIVGALLVVGYVLGLVALGRSNSRSDHMRTLLQVSADAQILVSDTSQLTNLLSQRQSTGGRSAELAIDSAVLTSSTQFEEDLNRLRHASGLRGSDARFAHEVRASVADFRKAWLGVVAADQAGRYGRAAQLLAFAASDEDSAYIDALTVAGNANEEADAVVAANHRAFHDSRDLLLGVAGGSLALALALGLLLSWSVVAPLRRTGARLDEIAAGEFEGRLEVANRDEIGALAGRVNRMSDELQRLYRELALASEHKSQFLATMSHELRTPLNAIIGFSEVLQQQMFGELNERQLAYVEDVLEAGKHLLSLINDVLDLAKIEAGRMELELSEVAIPELLRGAVSMHAERAARGDLDLSLRTEPDEITVTADERRVRQIVFNLLSNAVKFTPPQGRVDVSARVEDGRVEIAVADNGPGIAPEDVETIFEEFEQTSTGKQTEGTGLGLPLSRKLAELHGGRLWVESEPGRGSIFRLTLPV
jgi:signal transduction histidine kinase